MEEKTWIVHSSCKLSPKPKTRVANMRWGLPNFPFVARILFLSYPERKYHIRVFELGAKWHFRPGYGEKLFYSTVWPKPALKSRLSVR